MSKIFQSGIPSAQCKIFFNMQQLTDNKKTLKEYGINEGDLVLIQRQNGLVQRPSNPASSATGIMKLQSSMFKG